MRTSNTAARRIDVRRLPLSCVLALAVTLMGSAMTFAEKPEGCKFQGSWFGFSADGFASWMSTAHGQSSSIGTYIVEYPGFNYGLFWPTAVKGSTLRGTWERTGEYTFAFTVITLALDSAGHTVGIGKLSGTDSLSGDCSTTLIENTLEVFLDGSKNPFEDYPEYLITLPPHYGYRIKVDPPDQAGGEVSAIQLDGTVSIHCFEPGEIPRRRFAKGILSLEAQVLSANETVELDVQETVGVVADLASNVWTDRRRQILGPFHRINHILA